MAVEQGDKFQFPDEIADKKDEEKKGLKFEFVVEGEEGEKVDVIDDTPDRDKNQQALKDFKEPDEEELKAYSEGVRTRIKQMDHARHDERRAKEAALRENEEAVRYARQVAEENKRLKQYVETGTKAFAETSKAAATAELESAEQEYRAAHEAYDTEALLKAQKRLNTAQLKLHAAENFRAPPLQEEKSSVERQSQQQELPKPSEKTVRWQAKNQWFGVDDEMTALALAAHKKLVGRGVAPDSDEYFAQLDARMHEKFPEVFGETSRSKADGDKPAAKKSATVVASATRSSGTKKITLTQTQVALAKKMGLSLEQYAQAQAQLEQQNGR